MSLIEKNKSQFIRFAVVGAMNTVVDFGLLIILKSVGLPVISANTISTGTAFIFSFFANKKYTFRSSDSNIYREMMLFVVVTLFGLWVLQNTVIFLLEPLITPVVNDNNLALLLAKLVATAVSMIWNYLLYDKLVFKKHHRS